MSEEMNSTFDPDNPEQSIRYVSSRPSQLKSTRFFHHVGRKPGIIRARVLQNIGMAKASVHVLCNFSNFRHKHIFSAGCKNCYAERLAFRLQAMGNHRYRNGFMVTLHEDLIGLPKRWREPRLIFVNSMSDLFHEQVPLEFIQRVFATMRACRQHTFQILTKRSGRLRKLASELDWPANVWMGVSIEIHASCRASMIYEGFQPLFAFFLANLLLARSREWI
jgi:hypothetical protein